MNSFISLLLNKNPETRLGGSYANLKKHSVFSKIEWHEIISKKMKPLFEIPESKLVDLSSLKAKTKPLKEVLRMPNKAAVNRKDYDANWDAVF